MNFRVLLFFYFLMANILFCNNTFAEEKLLDKVVAIVNSQVITQSELNQQLRMMRPAGSQQQALNELINIALQKSVAKKANITISNAQLDQAISKIAAQNNMGIAQLQKNLAAQGMSYSGYRQQIHDQMLISEVQHAMISSRVKVTPEDIAAAENGMPSVTPSHANNTKPKYHIVDILIINPDNADKLLSKIRSTDNPGKILNNNPAIKISDLGFRKLSDLPSVFVKPAESLSPGQFSDVIQAPNGAHIISLLGIQGDGQFNRAPKLTPEQIAYEKKYNEALQKWLQTLRSQSYIKIID